MSAIVQQLASLNLNDESGLASLNALLANRSYVEGYTPSQADVTVFGNLGGKAPQAKFPHALRWYNHIASYPDAERKKFPGVAVAPAPGGVPAAPAAAAAQPAAAKKPADDDDDIDLFGSDDEVDEEAERARQERLKAYAEKKAKKPALIAKSSVVLDIKPWDDETDMKEMERRVRQIEMDGLLWGASKLVPLAFGIKKLQIMTTVEDDKVSIEELSEKIEAIEDYVQSVDIAAFNKI